MAVLGVVEDDSIFRENFIAEVKDLHAGYQVRAWESGEKFLREAVDGSFPPLDALFLDIRLPGMSGLEILTRLSRRNASFPVVMLTSLNSDETIFKALTFGAVGYIYKSELSGLGESIETVLNGGAIISPTIALRVVHSFSRSRSATSEYEDLTPREKEVLDLLVCGMTAREAAGSLCVSPHTLRVHVKNIYGKLQVSNKAELMLRARDFGLL